MMYVYQLKDGGIGVYASEHKSEDLIGTVNNAEELAAILRDENLVTDYAGEISKTFADPDEW